MRARILAVAAIAILASTVSISASSGRDAGPLTAPYKTRDPGQRLYIQHGCYQCHGLVGQGSVMSGPSLSPWRFNDLAFRQYVRKPTGAMPPYTLKVLPDEDLAQILRFVRSLPAGRPYSSIPVLAAAANSGVERVEGVYRQSGDLLYQRNCAMCHGASLEGAIAPGLLDASKRRDAKAIAFLIVNPPPGMPKLHPDPLSQADVEAVSQFVAAGK